MSRNFVLNVMDLNNMYNTNINPSSHAKLFSANIYTDSFLNYSYSCVREKNIKCAYYRVKKPCMCIVKSLHETNIAFI